MVDQLASTALRGQLEGESLVETARAHERRVKGVGAVRRGDEQDVGHLRGTPRDLVPGRHEQVDPVGGPCAQLLAACRLVERLHLHEQLVDHGVHVTATSELRNLHPVAGDGLHRKALEPPAAHRRGVRRSSGRRGAQAGAAEGDRIELVDEADCTTLGTCGLAQRLEVRPNLALRRPLHRRLERRAGGEQERHSGFGRQRLGGVGLACSGSPLEEQAAPGAATHLPGERLMRQEQLQRTHDLALDDVDSDDVVEAHPDLLGTEDRVL